MELPNIYMDESQVQESDDNKKPNFFMTGVRHNKLNNALQFSNEKNQNTNKLQQIEPLDQNYEQLLTQEQRLRVARNKNNFYISKTDLSFKNLKQTTNSKNEILNHMKINLRSGHYDGVVHNMRVIFDETNEDMLKLAEKKQSYLISGLNKFKYEAKKAGEYFQKLKKEHDEINNIVIQGNEEDVVKDSKLQNKLQKFKELISEEDRLKQRLLKIIDICKKNKDHNEDWIRQLNNFKQNIAKMIKERKDNISDSIKEVSQLKKLQKNTIEQYTYELLNRRSVLKNYVSGKYDQMNVYGTFCDMRNIQPEINMYALEEPENIYSSVLNKSMNSFNSSGSPKSRSGYFKDQDKIRKLKNYLENFKSVFRTLRKYNFDSIDITDSEKFGLFKSKQYNLFLEKLDKQKELKLKLKTKRLELANFNKKMQELADRGEYFEFMIDQNNHAEKELKLEKFDQFQGEYVLTQAMLTQATNRMNDYGKKQSFNVDCVNNLFDKIQKLKENELKFLKKSRFGMKEKIKIIPSTYSNFDLEQLVLAIGELKKVVFKNMQKPVFDLYVEGKIDLQTLVSRSPGLLGSEKVNNEFGKNINFLSQSQYRSEDYEQLQDEYVTARTNNHRGSRQSSNRRDSVEEETGNYFYQRNRDVPVRTDNQIVNDSISKETNYNFNFISCISN